MKCGVGRDLVAEAAADVLGDEAKLVERTRSAGPIQIAATPGIWWLQWSVNWPVPRSYSTRAAEHSSGVEEKRSKWSSLIFTTRSAACERAVHVAPVERARPDDVRAGVLVEDGRPSSCALARVDEHVERLVLDLDELGGVARELARLGDDGDDRVADVADAADRERVVLDLVAGRRRELEERVGQRRDLVAGQRPVDAGQRQRRRDVDRDDQRVRVRRAHEVHVAHAVPLDVVDEHALALEEPPVLLARDALARGIAGLELDAVAVVRSSCSLLPRCRLHRLDDVPVAGAAADVALDRAADLVVGRLRVLLQQGGRAHQHPRRAVAALERRGAR